MRSGLPLCITGLYWLVLADRADQALAERRARLREAPLPVWSFRTKSSKENVSPAYLLILFTMLSRLIVL